HSRAYPAPPGGLLEPRARHARCSPPRPLRRAPHLPKIHRIRQKAHRLEQIRKTARKSYFEAALFEAVANNPSRPAGAHDEWHFKIILRCHPGVDKTRIDDLYGEARPLIGESQGFGHIDQGGLGRTIGERSFDAAIARQGGVERDLAAPAPLHGGEYGIEAIDRAADIDLESAPDDIGREFIAFGDEIDARVYEGERDLSVRSFDLAGEPRHARAIRYVAGKAEDILRFRRQRCKFGGSARRRRDFVAAPGKFERHRPANPGTRARHPRNAVPWKCAIHEFSLVECRQGGASESRASRAPLRSSMLVKAGERRKLSSRSRLRVTGSAATSSSSQQP